MDLQHLRASDGTGEAVLAHIQSVRNPGSTVLDLDNVDNWNSKVIVVTGTPAANGFIAAAGMKVMYGSIVAGDLNIAGFAPGYVDNGNTTSEVAIVKMTTNWADALVDILKQTLKDNGKIKDDAIDSELMFADNVDPVKRTAELFFDHVAQGAVLAGLGYGANLNGSLTSGVAYINGYRQIIPAVASRAFTASKDTYVDALYNSSGTATIVYTEVANNAASPALAANSVRLGIVVSGAANILNVGSINQGQEDKVLPIISSNPTVVTDTLGNLICPRDPNRKILGMHRRLSNKTATSLVAVEDLSIPVQLPTARKVKITFQPGIGLGEDTSSTQSRISIWDGTVGSGTQLQEAYMTTAAANQGMAPACIWYGTLSAGLHTINGGLRSVGAGTTTLQGAAINPIFLTVELM